MEITPSTLAQAVTVGNLQAEVARVEVLLNTPQARWKREADDPAFAVASVAYGLLFLILIPLGFASFFFYSPAPAGLLSVCWWYGVIRYGRVVRGRFDVRRNQIQAEFEARFHPAVQPTQLPQYHPKRCAGCGAAAEATATACAYCQTPL